MIFLTYSEYWQKGSHGFSSASKYIVRNFWEEYSYSYFYSLLNKHGKIKSENLKIIKEIIKTRKLQDLYYSYLFDKYTGENKVNTFKVSQKDFSEIENIEYKFSTKSFYKDILTFLNRNDNSCQEDFNWKVVEYRMCQSLVSRPDRNLLKRELLKEKKRFFIIVSKNEERFSKNKGIKKLMDLTEKELFVF